jgi:chromosome segregation ATPase
MADAITTHANRRRQLQADKDAQAEASWRERALNAEDALKAALSEIRTQRERIGLLLGQIRDLEDSYDEDTTQRVAAENTTLRQRAGQLAQDNRALEEKLQAARSNNRFLDKRIANLEARLLDDPASRR